MGILEDNLSALGRQFIDHAGNGFLISRDRVGAEDDRIVRLDRDLAVHVRRHPGESRHGFSLASRCDEHHLLRRIILHLIDLDQCILRYMQITELRRRGDDIHHAASLHHNLSAVLVRGVDDLLHAIHIGRECCDDQSCILMLRENMVECDTHRPLRLRKSSALRVRTV